MKLIPYPYLYDLLRLYEVELPFQLEGAAGGKEVVEKDRDAHLEEGPVDQHLPPT